MLKSMSFMLEFSFYLLTTKNQKCFNENDWKFETL